MTKTAIVHEFPLIMVLRHFLTAVFCALFLGIITRYPPSAAGAEISSLPAGSVVNLGDGRPWLVVQSTNQTGTKVGYSYIMAMYNYGDYGWGSGNSDPATAISVLADSGTIYSNLPTTIGGIDKSSALGSHIWQWDICSGNSPAVCSNSTTSTSRLSFVSFKEWQGDPSGFNAEPNPGSVGNLFCRAWKGTSCLGSNLYSGFYYPWTRSSAASDESTAWFIYGTSVYSLANGTANSPSGSLPVAWLSHELCTNGGSGTFASPFTLKACNTPPSLALSSPTNNPWTNSAITVAGTVTDPDTQTLTIQYQIDGTNGTWHTLTTAASPVTSKAFSVSVNVSSLSSGSHTLYTRVTDGISTSNNVQTSFRVDTTKPTLTLNNSGTTYYNTAKATITNSDTNSGIKTIRYAWSTSTSNPTNITTSTCSGGTALTGFTIGQTTAWTSNALTPTVQGINYLHVCVIDVMGNITKTHAQYNYDTIAPTCTTSGGSATWTNGNRTITGTCADTGGSGCAGNISYTYSVNTNITTGGAGANGTAGSVKDNAGNTAACSANQTVKIDKVAPTCTVSGGSTTWTNGNRTIIGTCSDTGGSGCSGTNLSYTYSTNTNLTTAGPGTNGNAGSVSDAAGNTAACSANQTVKIDKTAPTCTTSGGNSTWTNGNRTITGTCADTGGSGCAGNISYTYSVTTNITTAGAGTNGAAGSVKDNAGNTAACSANQTVKIDKTAPTCTTSGGSATWTNGNRTITGTCADTGGSGCAGTNPSYTYSVNTNITNGGAGTNGTAATVSDAAGNTAACSANQIVKIDKTAPTFTFSPTPTGTNNYLTTTALTITSADTGGAGVVETRYATTNALNSACTSGGTVGTTLNLVAGTNNIYVCVRDHAGNVSTSATTYNTANIYQVNRGAIQPSPEPAINNSIANIGAFASYVSGYSSLILSGTVNDADTGQTLTVQYQIDNIAGIWSNLATLTANASNQSWSGTINLPTGLTAGVHNIYIRIYDGYAYSGMKNMSFVLDEATPSNAISLIGGTKCTGIPTIYCTAPTAIDLSAMDNQSGIGAYRTAWDNAFTTSASTPTWINGIPSTLATTNHTTVARQHTLHYQTRDKVGNVSSVDSINYYVNAVPTITLNDADNDRTVTSHIPLVFSGTFTDLDKSQSAVVKATLNGVAYQSNVYQTTGEVIAWEIIIPSSALSSLTPEQLTNINLTVTDNAGTNATTLYTGQITISNTSAEVYLSTIKNTPFALMIGKAGAFNIAYGTNQDITVSQNGIGEVIVSGQLANSTQVAFGVTTLVFTVLDEPDMVVQEVEFI